MANKNRVGTQATAPLPFLRGAGITFFRASKWAIFYLCINLKGKSRITSFGTASILSWFTSKTFSLLTKDPFFTEHLPFSLLQTWQNDKKNIRPNSSNGNELRIISIVQTKNKNPSAKYLYLEQAYLTVKLWRAQRLTGLPYSGAPVPLLPPPSIWVTPSTWKKIYNMTKEFSVHALLSSIAAKGEIHKLSVRFSLFKWNSPENRNPTIFNIIRWVDGPNNSATKCLMFQALFFYLVLFSIHISQQKHMNKYHNRLTWMDNATFVCTQFKKN